MEQLEFFPLSSPCIGVCEVNNRGYCKGCLRSRDERFRWQSMTPAEQRDVLRLCRARRARLQAAARKHEGLDEQSNGPQASFDL